MNNITSKIFIFKLFLRSPKKAFGHGIISCALFLENNWETLIFCSYLSTKTLQATLKSYSNVIFSTDNLTQISYFTLHDQV